MDDKQLLGLTAARKIQNGMTVGLGTGSTASCFIEALAERCRQENLKITAVASSPISAIQASALGLPLLPWEQLAQLDVYVDGADEVAADLTLLKGRGQDLVREKLLARAASQFWVLVDRSKLVNRVGEKFPIPVEVWPFAWQLVKTQLEAAGACPTLRLKEGGVAVTSSGGVVLDTRFKDPVDVAAIDRLLNDLPGVLEHGIFRNLASVVFIAADGQIEEHYPNHLSTTSIEESIMLTTNQPAPDFSALNQEEKLVSLADFRGKKNVVLYFYPKDDTPGCTTEAKGFTELADEFAKYDTVVIGVSKDPCDMHRAFIAKHGLKVDLLADTDGTVCERYGVWQEKEKNGVKKWGIVRSTFIIDKNGNLIDVEYGVNPAGHAQAVLEKIKRLAA